MSINKLNQSERTSGLRAIFSLPFFYEGFQTAIGAKAFRNFIVENYIKPNDGAKVLDVGCGTADILDHLPNVEYVGIDHSPQYVARARERFGHRATFLTNSAERASLIEYDDFDIALALGVLHHLDDHTAEGTLQFVKEKTRRGGSFVSVDPTFTEDQNLIAKILAKNDRGQHVRTVADTKRLLTETLPSTEVSVHHNLLRVPYSHVVCVSKID